MNNSRNGNQNDPGQSEQNEHGKEVSLSPGSQSTSSSSRQYRVVELIPENENDDRLADWIIRAEFYDEDVAQNSGNISADDTDGDEQGLHPEPEDLEDHDTESEDYDADLDPFVEEFVIEPDEEDRSSTDSEEDSDRIANYDTTLPVSHRYLGENLEESRGRRVLAENSIISLPLFNLRNVVLFPGQVLPITTANLNPRIQMYLKACLTRGATTIGLVSDPQNNLIGTTAEIRNYSVEDDELRLIMEGRQRFKLLSAPFEAAIEGELLILPEVSLGHPYTCISSLVKFFSKNGTPNQFIISKHPPWLLKKYEARTVMQRILDEIKDWCCVDVSNDPSEFSYWVAANLPISNKDRTEALSFSCTEARLIWLLKILEDSEYFCCSSCKNIICYKKDVFPMSRSGPQCSFVNAGGFVHDTLTVQRAQGLIQEVGWSREFSWFPGYAWRMAHCDICNRHIGWCYKRIEAETKPKRFFGLSRSNVRLSAKNVLSPTLRL